MSETAAKVRKIIHFDMDAFYASVEIQDNLELKGKPVVVGGSPESRAVICAASYEARKFGIRSAISCARAKRLCPDAIFLPPRFHRYKEISRQVHRIFRRYTELIEPVSLDEAWLDVTHNFIGNPSATRIAEQIKDDIKTELNLTGSAGVSYNKFLAKIASDERKPDGLFVITPDSAYDFLKNIPVRKLPGIGRTTARKLQLFGIEYGHQLREKSEQYLESRLGKFGRHLFRIIRGIDNRPIVTNWERKSVGIENTFPKDHGYGKRLFSELDKLIEGLLKRLERAKKQGHTLTLKVKFSNFRQVTRSVTTTDPIRSFSDIRKLAYQKLIEVSRSRYKEQKVRLLGISVSNFEKKDANGGKNRQLDIFYFLNNKELWIPHHHS